MYRELLDLLEKASNPSIGVVGDLMLDRYLRGRTDRVSPEAPVPVVAVDRSKCDSAVGGAGSVMRHLKALGANVWAAGVVGRDASGDEIFAKLISDGVDVSLVLRDQGRRTTRKTRVLSRAQQLLRIDEDESRPLEPRQTKAMADAIIGRLEKTDVLILSDYVAARGVLSRELIAPVAAAARKRGTPVWADPARGRNFFDFKGVSAVTPNRKETEDATGLEIARGSVPADAAAWLVGNLDLATAVITLDVEGIYYRTASGESGLLPARPRAAYDVTGAGDMVIAAAAMGIGCGMGLAASLALANFAAGMEVERIGVQPLERREILRRLRSQAHIASEKVLETGEMLRLLENHRRRGEKIVFTNGCFDVLHMGHVSLLEFARDQGDLLVVGLNSDVSVRAIKGPNRPILTQVERATVLAALEVVDYVVIFDDPAPAALINAVRPDILVKGEEWRERRFVGREIVEARGGKVIFAVMVPGLSTSGVVERIISAQSGGQER